MDSFILQTKLQPLNRDVMRLLHLSDLHTHFPKLWENSFDLVVLTGDIFPDAPSGSSLKTKLEWQTNWLNSNIESFQMMLQGKPLFFVLGNHDWIPDHLFEQILRENGIDATSLHYKVISYGHTNFYGLPNVPPINGEYNYETSVRQMEVLIDEMVKVCNETYIDVLAAHAPIYQCLDMTSYGQRIGNATMANALDYKIKNEMLPKYYLCGHNHKENGMMMRGEMLVVNSATKHHIIHNI